MKKNKKTSKETIKTSEMYSVKTPEGMPETAFDMVNYYGTYEIQPTAHTDNQYPAIAQGYNDKIRRRDGENHHPINKKK